MHTHRLDKGTDLLDTEHYSYGFKTDRPSPSGFIRLPVGRSIKGIAWQIILELTGTARGLLPLEIVEDVILGRGEPGKGAPDLDLTALDALELGVSRRHALLRPTPLKLYFIDLGSSNGTLFNGGPLGAGVARPLAEDTHISLGKLNMRVAHIKSSKGITADDPGQPHRPIPPGRTDAIPQSVRLTR